MANNIPMMNILFSGQPQAINNPASTLISPENASQPQPGCARLLNQIQRRNAPKPIKLAPNKRVSTMAPSIGLTKAITPPARYSKPLSDHKMKLVQGPVRQAWISCATPPKIINKPMNQTLTTAAMKICKLAITPKISKRIPTPTNQPHLEATFLSAAANSGLSGNCEGN